MTNSESNKPGNTLAETEAFFTDPDKPAKIHTFATFAGAHLVCDLYVHADDIFDCRLYGLRV